MLDGHGETLVRERQAIGITYHMGGNFPRAPLPRRRPNGRRGIENGRATADTWNVNTWRYVGINAAVVCAVAGSTAAAGMASTPGEQTVIRIATTMGANIATGVSCVDLGGPDASGNIVFGAAVRKTRAIKLNARHTCLPLIEWQRTGKFTPRAFHALITIGHEIAHTRGVRNEARAQCIGAQAAVSHLRRLRMTLLDRLRARQWLRTRHDKLVPPAYRLSSITCHLRPDRESPVIVET